MRLPNEIALDIVSYLNKTQFKSVRLVSKQWCDCGSQYLFDQLYVSPRKEDLDVFESVTQHPILSNCVRRLINSNSLIHSLTITRIFGKTGSSPRIYGRTNCATMLRSLVGYRNKEAKIFALGYRSRRADFKSRSSLSMAIVHTTIMRGSSKIFN